MKNVMKALQKPVITGVVLLGLLLVYDHHNGHLALAASGGRMGGSSFRSSSRSSSSRSRSSPSRTYNSGVRPESAYELGPLNFRIIITFFAIIFAIYFLLKRYADEDTVKTSVLKLQVGLLGTTRSLQKDLNQIAESADTSRPEGFKYILQESILALLRHPDYCISSYSSVDVKRGVKESEKQFNQLSVEERDKFDEETLVNVNNIKKKSATTQISNGVCNEYIVVTIIVAASGVHELPPIKSSSELKKALQKLASIPSSKIMAAEVLWTPQIENECLTKQEMLEDYPLLRPL